MFINLIFLREASQGPQISGVLMGIIHPPPQAEIATIEILEISLLPECKICISPHECFKFRFLLCINFLSVQDSKLLKLVVVSFLTDALSSSVDSFSITLEQLYFKSLCPRVTKNIYSLYH